MSLLDTCMKTRVIVKAKHDLNMHVLHNMHLCICK